MDAEKRTLISVDVGSKMRWADAKLRHAALAVNRIYWKSPKVKLTIVHHDLLVVNDLPGKFDHRWLEWVLHSAPAGVFDWAVPVEFALDCGPFCTIWIVSDNDDWKTNQRFKERSRHLKERDGCTIFAYNVGRSPSSACTEVWSQEPEPAVPLEAG